MKILIALPAFNEEKSVAGVLKKIPKDPGFKVLVVDDGSTDQTAKIARACYTEVISHPRNLGVGRAFHTILDYAQKYNADILVTIDADGQFDPSHIPILIDPIIRGEAHIVTCSRFLKKELIPADIPRLKLFGNCLMASAISFLIGQKITDAACGFRAYSREAFLNLNLFGKFTYTQETLLDLAYKGFFIREIALTVQGSRLHGKSHISSNLLMYGLRTLRIIFKTVRDYKPLRVFGMLGILTVFLGFIFEIIPFYHFFKTNSFTPYKFLAFLGGGFIALGILVGLCGILADMLKHIRLTQEKILYYAKSKKRPD